uniref:Uncharacterized protein n=1 Tax=Cucumis sativus TaxID=3659 RepID=A0A0A0L8F2_CUCSA
MAAAGGSWRVSCEGHHREGESERKSGGLRGGNSGDEGLSMQSGSGLGQEERTCCKPTYGWLRPKPNFTT